MMGQFAGNLVQPLYKVGFKKKTWFPVGFPSNHIKPLSTPLKVEIPLYPIKNSHGYFHDIPNCIPMIFPSTIPMESWNPERPRLCVAASFPLVFFAHRDALRRLIGRTLGWPLDAWWKIMWFHVKHGNETSYKPSNMGDETKPANFDETLWFSPNGKPSWWCFTLRKMVVNSRLSVARPKRKCRSLGSWKVLAGVILFTENPQKLSWSPRKWFYPDLENHSNGLSFAMLCFASTVIFRIRKTIELCTASRSLWRPGCICFGGETKGAKNGLLVIYWWLNGGLMVV